MEFDYDEKVAEVKAVCDKSPNGLTSIYADLRDGRRSEVEPLVATDPFVKEGVATAAVTEIATSFAAAEIAALLA